MRCPVRTADSLSYSPSRWTASAATKKIQPDSIKRLTFAGVNIVTLAEGDITHLHIGFKGTMNALFLKDLAEKTHRGLHEVTTAADAPHSENRRRPRRSEEATVPVLRTDEVRQLWRRVHSCRARTASDASVHATRAGATTT